MDEKQGDKTDGHANVDLGVEPAKDAHQTLKDDSEAPENNNVKGKDNDVIREPAAAPRRVASVVVVVKNDEHGQDQGRGTKRQAEPNLFEQPEIKKRNRRLFGALLAGTLQKAKAEEDRNKTSEIAQRRAELHQRLEEKQKKQEQQRQVDSFKPANDEEDENSKMSPTEYTLSVLETVHSRQIAIRDLLDNYILTTTREALPVYWTPAKHTQETEEALEIQRRESKSWKESRVIELEREKQAVLQGGDAEMQPVEPGPDRENTDFAKDENMDNNGDEEDKQKIERNSDDDVGVGVVEEQRPQSQSVEPENKNE